MACASWWRRPNRHPEAHGRVVHGDEHHGQEEGRPRLVEGDEREDRVEPDVQVRQPAPHVHEDVGADHQPEADRAGAGDLAAQHLAEDEQAGDRGELSPEEPVAHPPRDADGGQRGHVEDEDAGDDPVPTPEAGLVEPHSAGNACPEPGAEAAPLPQAWWWSRFPSSAPCLRSSAQRLESLQSRKSLSPPGRWTTVSGKPQRARRVGGHHRRRGSIGDTSVRLAGVGSRLRPHPCSATAPCPLGLGGDGERRVDAEVRRRPPTVDHVRPA